MDLLGWKRVIGDWKRYRFEKNISIMVIDSPGRTYEGCMGA